MTAKTRHSDTKWQRAVTAVAVSGTKLHVLTGSPTTSLDRATEALQ